MTDHAASAPAANEPTPGANGALDIAAIMQRAQWWQHRLEEGDYSEADAVMYAEEAVNDVYALVAALRAANARIEELVYVLNRWKGTNFTTLITTYEREFTLNAEHEHTQEWKYDVGKLLEALKSMVRFYIVQDEFLGTLRSRMSLSDAEIETYRQALNVNHPTVIALLHIIMRMRAEPSDVTLDSLTDATAPTLEARLASGNRTIAPDELNEAITLIVAGKVRPIEGVDYARMPTAPTRETPILGNVHHFVEDDDFDSPSPHDDPCGPTPCGESDPPAPGAPAAAAKLTERQRLVLEKVKGGTLRTHKGSQAERELLALETLDLVEQKGHSYWYLTPAGRRALADATPNGGAA